jgi:prephenate dehydrogenase
MELLVVGAGEMGRWLARTVPADVAFADVDESAARAAASATGGRVVPVTGDETFTAVCLAVPIPALEDAVAVQADRAEAALLDVTGVMRPAVAAMRAHASDRERVSLHPLFAAANAPGNVAVVADAPGPVSDEVLSAVAAAGNEVFETDPAEHDEAMETVQAAAHAAVISYALAAREVRPEFHTPVSSELSDLASAVTGGNPGVYRDIQAAFEGADRVAAAARRVADADPDGFEALYREAGRQHHGDSGPPASTGAADDDRDGR